MDTDFDSQMLGNTGAQGNSQVFVVSQCDLPRTLEMRDNRQAVHEQLLEQQLAEQLQAVKWLADQRLTAQQQAEQQQAVILQNTRLSLDAVGDPVASCQPPF